MKLFYVEITTSRGHDETLIIRAKSSESIIPMIEEAYGTSIKYIVKNPNKDINIQEYSFEGKEEVLMHG